MKRRQDHILGFLIENMREMETELRAQSIVFEALAQKVIGVDEVGDALSLARKSTDMQEFVRLKYLPLSNLGAAADATLASSEDETHEFGFPVLSTALN